MFKDVFCVCQQLIKIDIWSFFYEGMIDHIGNMKGKQIWGQHFMLITCLVCLWPWPYNFKLLLSSVMTQD